MTEDDVHYSADGEPLAVQARRLVVENQRLTEKLRRVREVAEKLDREALPVPAFHGDEIADRIRRALSSEATR